MTEKEFTDKLIVNLELFFMTARSITAVAGQFHLERPPAAVVEIIELAKKVKDLEERTIKANTQI
jgi:hypothetical protein